MHIYKAYRLDHNGDFKTGCWIDASNDRDARRKAAELCEEGTAGVEVFRDSKRIDEIDCDPAD